jgi:hypothetical protein
LTIRPDLQRIERKRRLIRLTGKTKQITAAIQFPEHLTGDGPTDVRSRLQDRIGGHRPQVSECALSQRTFEDVAQVEKSGERCRARHGIDDRGVANV